MKENSEYSPRPFGLWPTASSSFRRERAALLPRFPDAGAAPHPASPTRGSGQNCWVGKRISASAPPLPASQTLPARRNRPDFGADAADQGAGTQPGTAEQPASSVRSLHVQISTLRGEGRVPPHISSLKNPRVSMVPSQKPGLNQRDNDSFHSHWPPAF